MGGREVSRLYRVWFFAEGERFLSFWRCHSTNDRCEALASPKGCFLCFLFLCHQHLSTEPRPVRPPKKIVDS